MAHRSKWKWFGYAGHLCVGKRCAFHLSTHVGHFLVSTIGHYISDNKDRMEPIGSGEQSLFETMVFPCNDAEIGADPNIISWESVDGERYATSADAEREISGLPLRDDDETVEWGDGEALACLAKNAR